MKIKINLFNRKNFNCNGKIDIEENHIRELSKKTIGYSYLKEFKINKDYLDNFDFQVPDKEELKKISWVNSIDNIKEVGDIEDEYPSELKKNSLYYKSIYMCPNCNEQVLYKVRSYDIGTKFNNTNKRLHHIYTCPKCRIFLASIRIYSKLHYKWIGNRLSNYALISYSYPRLKYRRIVAYTESLHSE